MRTPTIIAEGLPGFVIALLILGVFAVIVIAVILIKKYTKVFKSDEKPKSEKEVAKEELDRILEPIDTELVEKPEEAEDEEPTQEQPKSE